MSALENAKNMSVEDILAKTAASGLLEMCIRDRYCPAGAGTGAAEPGGACRG